MGNSPSAPSYDTQTTLAEKYLQKRPIVIAFLSPSCGLCRSIEPRLAQAGASGLQVARLDSSKPADWAPEMLVYNIESVPCCVLVDSSGRAVGKTAITRNQNQMLQAMDTLLSKSR